MPTFVLCQKIVLLDSAILELFTNCLTMKTKVSNIDDLLKHHNWTSIVDMHLSVNKLVSGLAVSCQCKFIASKAVKHIEDL